MWARGLRLGARAGFYNRFPPIQTLRTTTRAAHSDSEYTGKNKAFYKGLRNGLLLMVTVAGVGAYSYEYFKNKRLNGNLRSS